MNRLIYTFVHGDISENNVIGHICNNKGCINPNHLYLTTASENSTHAARDGLYVTGYKNEKYKQASEDWYRICCMYYEDGWTQQQIGNVYEIHQSRVSDIIRKNLAEYIRTCNAVPQ